MSSIANPLQNGLGLVSTGEDLGPCIANPVSGLKKIGDLGPGFSNLNDFLNYYKYGPFANTTPGVDPNSNPTLNANPDPVLGGVLNANPDPGLSSNPLQNGLGLIGYGGALDGSTNGGLTGFLNSLGLNGVGTSGGGSSNLLGALNSAGTSDGLTGFLNSLGSNFAQGGTSGGTNDGTASGGGSVWGNILDGLKNLQLPNINQPTTDPTNFPGMPSGTITFPPAPATNASQATNPALFSLLMGLTGAAGYMPTPSSSQTNTTGTTNQNTTGTTNQNTTGTNTTNGTNVTTPNLSPGQQGLIDQLTKQYAGITGGIPAAMEGIKNTGLQSINRGAQLANTGLNENLAARGLASSPAAGVATSNLDNQRFASQNQFLQSLPLTQQQMTLNAMGQAGNFALGIPHGQTQTTSGTGTTNQQTTGTTNQTTAGTTTGTSSMQGSQGGGLQGLLGGLASVLSEEMYGKNRQPVTYNINNNPSINAPTQTTTASTTTPSSSSGGSWLDTLKDIAKKIGGSIKIPGFPKGVEPPQSTVPVTTPPIIPSGGIKMTTSKPPASTSPQGTAESTITYEPSGGEQAPPPVIPLPPWGEPQGEPSGGPQGVPSGGEQQSPWPTSEEDTAAPGRIVYDPTTGTTHVDSGQPGPNINSGNFPSATPGEIDMSQFDPGYQDPFNLAGDGGEYGSGQGYVSDQDRSMFPGMSDADILSMKMSAPWAFGSSRG